MTREFPPGIPEADSIRSKGFTLRSALAFVEATYGLEGVARVLEEIDGESRAVLAGPPLASTWYPFRIQVALYETIDRVFGDGDLELCWEIGKFTSEHELQTIHKVFLRLGSLAMWIRSAGRMWGVYYSVGGLRADEIGEDGGTVTVTEFNPISKAFCYDFGGWLHRTIEMSGRTDVEVEHSDCVLDGADACRYVGRWHPK